MSAQVKSCKHRGAQNGPSEATKPSQSVGQFAGGRAGGFHLLSVWFRARLMLWIVCLLIMLLIGFILFLLTYDQCSQPAVLSH